MSGKKFKYYGAIRKASLSAGRILMKYFRKGVRIRYKNARKQVDPVSIADESAEREIIRVLGRAYPGYKVLCEESRSELDDPGGYCWIIDPLDGTVNFLFGIPIFSVSIGLAKDGKLMAGAVYNPATGDFYYAEKGRGAYRNGKRIRVSARRDIGKSMLVTGFPYGGGRKYLDMLNTLYRFLTRMQAARRFGSAALDLANIAEGMTDVFWESTLHAWDVAAGGLLVAEAGGRVTNVYGSSDYVFVDNGILATNGRLHGAALKILKMRKKTGKK